MVYRIDMIRGAASLSKDDLNKGFVYVIHLNGNLVMEVSDEFSLLLSTLIAGGMKNVVLDLTELKYVDSTGIGIFINASKQIRAKGGDLAFLNVNNRIYDTLHLVKLHEFISFFKGEKQVTDHFFAVSR